MSHTDVPRIPDISSDMENDAVQQYIGLGSNMFLGTKDGMKYTLFQSSDNKFRLVEAPSEINVDSKGTKRSTEIPKKDESPSFESLIVPDSEFKTIEFMQLKSEASPCKGQGDEIENSVLSISHSVDSFKETDNTLENVSLDENQIDLGNNCQLTYTTLLPRQEKVDTFNNFYYASPQSPYYTCEPTFSTPLGIRPARYLRKQRLQIIPSNDPYSPIQRGRSSTPRQRRPRRGKYQYNPQMFHSSIYNPTNLRFKSPDPIVRDSSSGSLSNCSFSSNQSSMEYPRVPNNTPISGESDVSSEQKVLSLQWMPQIGTRVENYIGNDPRETHNEKERRRRLRIKNACQSMRALLPCVSDKTDNATVFEQAAHFISYLRNAVGDEHDMEFIEQNYIL